MAEEQRVTINISTTALLKILLVALLLVALYLIRDIVLILVVSMVLASAMDPLVDWLFRKAKFPRGLSVVLVYLVFISAFGLVIYFLIPPIISQFSQLAGKLGDFRSEIAGRANDFADFFDQLGITASLGALQRELSDTVGNFFHRSLGVFSTLVQLVAVLAVTFYLISSENGMKNLIKSIVPYKHQAYAVSLTGKIQKKIGHWLLGQLILSGCIFALTFIGLTALGVKYALALALLAGLLEIIPYLGPILSAVPAVFVAFVQSPPLAVFVILLYVVVQEIENYILVPKVMGRTVGANPVIILLAVLIGFKLAGIVGMLVAVPIVAAASVFLSDLREARDHLA